MGMNKVKLEIEIVTSDKNKIQAETISNYILRAIAGVCGTNRSVVASYKCTMQRGEIAKLDALDNSGYKDMAEGAGRKGRICNDAYEKEYSCWTEWLGT